jgi:hypothetical protein
MDYGSSAAIEGVMTPASNTIKSTCIFADGGSVTIRIQDLMTLQNKYTASVKIRDHDDLNEFMADAYQLLADSPASKTIDLIVSTSVKNGKIRKPLLGVNDEDLFINYGMWLNARKIKIISADDAMAVAGWEKIGYGLTARPNKQIEWSRTGRLLALQCYHDHVGIGLMDGGRLINGLSFPDDDYTMNQCALVKSSDTDDGRYYRWSLSNLVKQAITDWSPDSVLVSIDSTDKKYMIGNTDEYTVPVHVVTSGDDRSDLLANGATMINHRELFGWKPRFLQDADERTRREDQMIEYEFEDASKC